MFRDRFGIRPIFYHSDNQKFYFCSEMKIIEVCKVLKYQEKELSLANMSILDMYGEQEAAFKDILQIPPGHCRSMV